jgi:phage-related protein
VDYEGDGAQKAKEDIKDLGDESKETATKIDQSTKKSSGSIEDLGKTSKKTDVTINFDQRVFQQFINNIMNIEKSTRRSVGGLNTMNSRVRLLAGAIALTAPHVAGLGVSLAALSGLAGVAAGALAGLAAVGSTLVVGMQGIGTAFKEAAAQTKAAGSGAIASAKAQRAAAQAIEAAKKSLRDAEENLQRTQEDAARAAIDAARAVVSAQRDLIDAQRDAVRAQQSLNRARLDATRQLEDMRSALTGGAFDERQALLDLKEAQEELAAVQSDPTASERERQQAILNLEKQQFALEQLRKENERLTADQAAAAAAGVEGSEQVVNAQDNIRDSAYAVQDAQQSLADAQENVRRTQIESSRAIQDAIEGIVEAQAALKEAYLDAAEAGAQAGAKLADAMADLSPNARAFVQEVLNQRGAWDELKKSVQDDLFGDLAKDVAPLAKTWFPLLRESMGGVAKGLNGMIDGVVEFAKASETQENVKRIFGNTSLALGEMKNVLRDLLFAFMDIATVGSDFLPELGKGAADAAARFRDFISEARKTGDLRRWMQDAMDTAGELWQLLKNLGSIISSVFTGLDQAGGGALNTLTDLTGKVAEFLKSAKGQEALQALGSVLKAIGGAVGKVFLSFLDVAAELLIALEPLLVGVAEIVGVTLAGAWQALGAVMQPVAEILGWMSPFLGPFIGIIYALSKAVAAAKVAFAALNVVMRANPFILVASLIAALALLIIQNWDTISAKLGEIWGGIKNAAAVAWGQVETNIIDPITRVGNWIGTVVGNIVGFFERMRTEIPRVAREAFNSAKNFIVDAVTSARDNVSRLLGNIVRFFTELPGKIWNYIKSFPGQLVQWGKDMIAGIVRGLGNAAGAIWRKLKSIVSDAWDSVKSFLGISSPSKLMAYAGEMMGEGLIRGIEAMRNGVTGAAEGLGEAAAAAMTGATGDLAATLSVAADTSGLPGSAALTSTVPLTATAPSGGAAGGQGGGTTIIIDNLVLHIAGNLDPTNPTAYREAIKRIKESIRTLDKEYV